MLNFWPLESKCSIDAARLLSSRNSCDTIHILVLLTVTLGMSLNRDWSTN